MKRGPTIDVIYGHSLAKLHITRKCLAYLQIFMTNDLTTSNHTYFILILAPIHFFLNTKSIMQYMHLEDPILDPNHTS